MKRRKNYYFESGYPAITKVIIFIMGILCNLSTRASDVTDTYITRTPDFPKINTPNAASFNKFIDNPISLYSGSIDVSIPLYTLRDGVVDLAINLRYNTSGIKADEQASWVGLGWNLNVGGVITQNSVGDFDEYDSDYKKITDLLVEKDSGFFDVTTGNHQAKLINLSLIPSIASYLATNYAPPYRFGKMNPDIFYFSYPGGNGKFFIDYRDDTIHQIQREKGLKIEMFPSSKTQAKRSFKITTETGIQHFYTYFSELGDQYSKHVQSRSYVLTKTIYPNGQVVNYTYQRAPVYQRSLSCFGVSVAGGDLKETYIGATGNTEISTMETKIVGDEFYLNRITTNNYIVDFQLTSRQDLENGKKLSGIKITPFSGPKTQFVFDYGYFTSDPEIGTWEDTAFCETKSAQSTALTDRLKLLAIHRTDMGDLRETHRFYYNETLLPPRHSYALDYWGNPNGSTEKSYFPEFDFYQYGIPQSQNDVLKFFPGLSSAPTDGRRKISGNRSYNFDKCQAAMLTGIINPTGGFQKFIYESNSFVRQFFIPTMEQEAQIKMDPPMIKTEAGRPLHFTVNERSKVTIRIEVLKGLNTWQTMLGSHALVLTALNGDEVLNGPCLNSYTEEEAKDTSIFRSQQFELDPGTYILIGVHTAPGEQSGPSGLHGDINVILSFDQEPLYTGHFLEVQGCGVRIRSIENYNSQDDSIPAKTFRYEYTDPNTGKSSGVLHEELRFNKRLYSYYPVVVSISGCHTMAVFHDMIYSNNIETNPYSLQPPVGYSYVKEIIEDGHNGFIVYNYWNDSPDVDQHSVRIDHCLNGKLIKKTLYNEKVQMIEREQLEYTQCLSHRYAGINTINQLNQYPSLTLKNTNGYLCPDYEGTWCEYSIDTSSFYRFAYLYLHKLDSYDVTLARKTSVMDGVTKDEIFSYNPNTLQLCEYQIAIPSCDTLRREYTYPNDYNIPVYAEMANNNRLTDVVEERVYANRQLLDSKLTSYGHFPGIDSYIIQPSSISYAEIEAPRNDPDWSFSASGANPAIYPTVNVTYHERDIYGNPVFITHNGQNSVYLWSYGGQFPVAEIKNATLDDVKQVLQVAGFNLEDLVKTQTPPIEKINKLRELLPQSQVSTYTYQSFGGIMTATDPSGRKTSYEYDVFGRLTGLFDDEGKAVESYKYHYRNE